MPAGSGSCSCGAAVAAIRRGLTADAVLVECDGGSVQVKWDGIGGVNTGGVARVFAGEIDATLLSCSSPVMVRLRFCLQTQTLGCPNRKARRILCPAIVLGYHIRSLQCIPVSDHSAKELTG